MKSDDNDRKPKVWDKGSAPRSSFDQSIERAVQASLLRDSDDSLSCPKPLRELVDALTDRIGIRANDVMAAVQRLEAQRAVVVISTASGWSVRLASRGQDHRATARTASSDSPWTMIRRQLKMMRAAEAQAPVRTAPERRTE